MKDAGSRHSSRNSRSNQRRHYISPYHESPVDLDKYDEEMNAADKSNAKDEGWAVGRDRREVKATKQRKNNKSAARPFTAGCAANFEIFKKVPTRWERC